MRAGSLRGFIAVGLLILATAAVMSSVALVHSSTVRIYCSSSVMSPRRYCSSTRFTSSEIILRMISFSGGTVMSLTAILVPDLVA